MLNLTKSIHGNSRAESLFVACSNFFIDGIKSAWQSGLFLPFLCQSHRLLVALDHFGKDKLQYPSCIFQVTGLIFSPQKIKFTACSLAKGDSFSPFHEMKMSVVNLVNARVLRHHSS